MAGGKGNFLQVLALLGSAVSTTPQEVVTGFGGLAEILRRVPEPAASFRRGRQPRRARVADRAGTAAPAGGHARSGGVDLLAFLGVLVLVLIADRAGQPSARLVFAGAAILVTGCVTAWRRLCRPESRRWRSGQAIYRVRRVTVVSAWGVEGQAAPAIQPPTPTAKDSDGITGPATPEAAVPPSSP
jgi:hypothetical protein